MLDRSHGRAVCKQLSLSMLDSLANILGLGHSLPMASNGNRIPGVFDQLSKIEEQSFRQQIDCICRQWHIECLQSNTSAGFVVEGSEGNLTSSGSLSVVAVGLEPFLC